MLCHLEKSESGVMLTLGVVTTLNVMMTPLTPGVMTTLEAECHGDAFDT